MKRSNPECMTGSMILIPMLLTVIFNIIIKFKKNKNRNKNLNKNNNSKKSNKSKPTPIHSKVTNKMIKMPNKRLKRFSLIFHMMKATQIYRLNS